MPELPTSTRALVLRKRDPVGGKVYHAVEIEERPLPTLQRGQVLVRVFAVGFNRRDVRRISVYTQIHADAGATSTGSD
jgi:NADPH:quinone reductase-like Zn-dependent oxidoreductase